MRLDVGKRLEEIDWSENILPLKYCGDSVQKYDPFSGDFSYFLSGVFLTSLSGGLFYSCFGQNL